MYDLEPVPLSKRSAYVKFTDAMVEKLSSQRHLGGLHTPLVLAYGTCETPEFQRQTKDFFAAVRALGKPVELIVGEAYNHFELLETLANPYGLMGRAMLSADGTCVVSRPYGAGDRAYERDHACCAAAVRMCAVRRQIDDVAVAHAAFRDDAVGELLHVGAAALEHRDLHAAFVVEVHMESGVGEIVTVVEIAGQALGQFARLVVIKIDQRRDARPRAADLGRACCRPERARSRIASERLA